VAHALACGVAAQQGATQLAENAQAEACSTAKLFWEVLVDVAGIEPAASSLRTMSQI